jgi:iron complex transport system substrate-binding protein
MSKWLLIAGIASVLNAPVSDAAPAIAPLVVTDDTGHTVTLPAIPTRIVSLAPGATEMLFAAGAGKRVIATVEYSDEPAAAKQVPRIGDVVAIDMEKLVALRPEVAVVWPGGGNPAQIEEIGRMGIPLYRQQVNMLADLAGSLRRLGALAGTRAVAEQAARNIETRLATLARTYGNGRHPNVLLEVWNHPIPTSSSPLRHQAPGQSGSLTGSDSLRYARCERATSSPSKTHAWCAWAHASSMQQSHCAKCWLRLTSRFIHERHSVSAETRSRRCFREREKQGCFSRSPHGWVHGGPENTFSIEASRARAPPVRE